LAHRVEIQLDSRAEAHDLLRALAVRGLAGALRPGASPPAVVLDGSHESTASLLADLLPALDAWRLDRSRGPLSIAVEGRRYSLCGDPDLERRSGEPTPQSPADRVAEPVR
jgi:hypothetical protein